MAERRPTRDQRALLAMLTSGQLRTRHLAALRGQWATYDGTHAALARLEKRGFVTRQSEPGKDALWKLTPKGRSHATS